jgi:mRNA interferase RelE/StbE
VSWRIEYLDVCRRQLDQLGPKVKAEILRFLREQVLEGDDPYTASRPLTGKWRGCVRFRIDEYRVICTIENKRLLVTAVKAGHRSDVYN